MTKKEIVKTIKKMDLKLKEYVYKYKECGCKVLFCGDGLDIWIG